MISRQTKPNVQAEAVPVWNIQQILVPIDFSENSQKALRFAARFAERFQAHLQLVHVIQSVSSVYDLGPHSIISEKLEEELKEHAMQKLTDLARGEIPASIAVNCSVRSGNAAEEIVESAKEGRADLIIAGTHGRSGLKHMFLGSVAEGTVRYAPCPVLVVRTIEREMRDRTARPQSEFRLKTILVAIDFSETSDWGLRYAESISKASGATLLITHVAPIHYPVSEYGVMECPQLDVELLEAGKRFVQEVTKEEDEKKIAVTAEVRQGNAGVEILEAANENNVDLIVLGTRGLTGLRHALLGSTVEYVMRHARCPVLTVRSPLESRSGGGALESTRFPIEEEMHLLKSIVASHPFFQGIAPTVSEIILKDAVVTEFAEDELIFRQGDCANKFYLIHKGKVALEYHTQERNVPVHTLGSGEVLGWSWLFAPFTWHFQARALEKTVAIELNGARLLVSSENDDKLGHQLMKRFAQILVQRLQETSKRLVEPCEAVELGGKR